MYGQRLFPIVEAEWADQPAVAGRDYAQIAARLAKGWDADTERAEPANDQTQRG